MKKKAEHDADNEAAKTGNDEVAAMPSSEEKTAVPETVTETAEQAFLAGRVAELEKLNADLNDQYLRKAADFDNYRKRMIKEKQDAIDFANTNLLVDLVQVLDDFDRAIASGGIHEEGSPGAALTDGVTIIRNHLGSMLENKYGLLHYPVKGEAFDPHIHEAIGTLPSPETKEPTVSEEFVKGYKLKDRVIRVAKVMVSMPVETEKQ